MNKAGIYIIILTVSIVCTSFKPAHKALNEYGKWLEFHHLKSDYFKKSLNEVESNIAWSTYGITNANIQLFSPFFIYTEDSSYYIDLDTYSLVLERDEHEKLISYGSNVDVKVQVINSQKKTSATLLFCGSQCFPETALWLTTNKVEIYGFKNNDDDQFVPTTWRIDIKNNVFSEYSNTKVFSKKPASYKLEKRLKSITFVK